VCVYSFQKVSNCNEAIRLCKEKLNIPLVAIGGVDLADGSKKLTVAIGER